jgi:hypothetical protein
MLCLRLEFLTLLVQVDLLCAERQRLTAVTKGDNFYAQNPAVKVAGYFYVPDG